MKVSEQRGIAASKGNQILGLIRRNITYIKHNIHTKRARTNHGRECIIFSCGFTKLVDNVKMHEPLGNSDHNQIHFDIKLKSESTNKNNTGETSTKVNIKI